MPFHIYLIVPAGDHTHTCICIYTKITNILMSEGTSEPISYISLSLRDIEITSDRMMATRKDLGARPPGLKSQL